MQSIAKLRHDGGAPVSALSGAQQKRRVLVIDDDPDTASMLAGTAKAGRCEIVVAKDGLEAYRLLKTGNDFHAAVINPMVPGLDGLELLRYAKSERRLQRIPIVVLSGDEGFHSVLQGFWAGAAACLWKPTSPDILWRTVRMLFPQVTARREAA